MWIDKQAILGFRVWTFLELSVSTLMGVHAFLFCSLSLFTSGSQLLTVSVPDAFNEMDRWRKMATASWVLLTSMRFQESMFSLSAALLDEDNEGSSYFDWMHEAKNDAFILRMSWLMLFQSMSPSLFPRPRRSRRFWAAPPGKGIWETQVLRTFRRMGLRGFEDWENDQYVSHLRMT